MSGKKLNVLIVGNNFGAKIHLPAFQSIDDVNATLHPKNTQIDWDNIDAVSLALPPMVSYEIIKQAIQHHKHIFCEKPLAANLQQADEIIRLLPHDIIHAIDFEMSQSRIVNKLREMVADKPFGNIINFRCTWNCFSTNTQSGWKLDINQGGGALNNFGSHIFHLLEYIFPEKISKITTHELSPSKENNTLVSASIDFASFNGFISIDTCRKSNYNSNLELEINCVKGDLILHNNTNVMKNFSLTQIDQNEINRLVDYEDKVSSQDGRLELVASLTNKFVNGIKKGEQVSPNIRDGYRVQQLINQLLRS